MTKDSESSFRPIFIVGNSRSGTTLMAQILRKHQDIFVFHELHFFENLWTPADACEVIPPSKGVSLCARLLSIQDEGYRSRHNSNRHIDKARSIVSTIDAKKLTAVAVYRAFMEYVTLSTGRIFAAEQTPRNVFYIGEILGLFPSARIINMIRDPRDVLASQKKKWRRHAWRKDFGSRRESLRLCINYHPITTSKLWHASIQAAEHFADDSRVLFLRFEDLIFQPEKMLQKVCDFLGVRLSKRMMSVRKLASSFDFRHMNQHGFDHETVGRWKSALLASELFYCQKINGNKMQRYGYSPSDVSPGMLSLIVPPITFPIKLGVAFLLNWRRYAMVSSAIRRRLCVASQTDGRAVGETI